MRAALRRPGTVVFLLASALYLLAGVVVTARHQILLGDALARVASASSAVHGQSPGLTSLGFVFPPLTALAQLPLVALDPIAPWLTVDGMSAVIVSALFAAGTVVQLDGIARDRGVRALVRVPVVVVFAVNPMIVFYAANGMSEAPYLFFLVWAVRRLIRWADDDDVHELIVAGIALALAYLTRYDGAVATAAAGVLVFVITWRRARGERRFGTAFMDLNLVAAPGLAAFLAWAVAGWMITGDLFAQFSSRYGNSAILAQTGGPDGAAASPAAMSAMSFVILAPTLPVLLVCAAVVQRRRPVVLAAPLAVFGAVLLFQTATFLSGGTFGFLRFTITAIPLAAILALFATPAGRAVTSPRPGRFRWTGALSGPPRRSVVAPTVAVLALAAALPTTTVGMGSPTYAAQEFALRTVFAGPADTGPELDRARRTALAFATERRIAEYLDAKGLPRASVAVDTASGFAIVARSQRPLQFIETADPDFTQAVNAPTRHGVRYLLTVPPTGRGEADALNLRYPTLFEDGAGVAELEVEARNDAPDQPDWRLYRVLGAGS
ncbi:ABC transporter [Tsukamurella hominis]|uniref:ABC transporter n=1 Tax=Tsukamurella hominis TaxID=1970232 RepID=UPI0039ED2B3A